MRAAIPTTCSRPARGDARIGPAGRTSQNRSIATLLRVEAHAVITVTIHVLEIVAVAVLLLLYLLIKVWRRI